MLEKFLEKQVSRIDHEQEKDNLERSTRLDRRARGEIGRKKKEKKDQHTRELISARNT